MARAKALDQEVFNRPDLQRIITKLLREGCNDDDVVTLFTLRPHTIFRSMTIPMDVAACAKGIFDLIKGFYRRLPPKLPPR